VLASLLDSYGGVNAGEELIENCEDVAVQHAVPETTPIESSNVGNLYLTLIGNLEYVQPPRFFFKVGF
jgi:hypothetical protein